MRLEDAQSILREVDGKPYSWLKSWGFGIIKEAIRTVEQRCSATETDRQRAQGIKAKVWREY